MFQNHFRIAWRNLVKDRQFTILNLAGLTTGLACAFLIYLWVHDERSVDKFHGKDAQLYQVMVNNHKPDGIETGNYTPGPLANALATEVPEIEYAVTVVPAAWFSEKGLLSSGDINIKATSQYIGKDYFNVFSCKFIEGDKNQLVSNKNVLAISKTLAIKLFKTTEDVVGKPVQWKHQNFGGSFIVGGVFEDQPVNATDQFDVLVNFDNFLAKREGLLSWGNSDPGTYVILRNGTDVAKLDKKIKSFLKSKNSKSLMDLLLVKYSDKYLHGQFHNGVQDGGRIEYVRLFSIIALFILVIACINFMNLSTAKASRRIKEVGIKKVIGARRWDLVFQYISESMLMSFFALLISIGLVIVLLPQFNSITGILSGSYPALYLSGFNPVTVLKGKLRTSVGELLVRKGLVVFQFTLSVIFIVSVVVIYKQVDYIQNKNLGYSRANIIHFEIPFEMDEAKLKATASFMNEIKNIPGVINTTSYYHNLTGDHGEIGGFDWPGKPADKNIDFANLEVGYNFIETMGIEMKEGKGFSYTDNSSSNEIVFNESAIKSMGLKDPIGKTVKFWDQKRQIVGVVKDFHFESLYEPVKPCFFQVYPLMPNVVVKIRGGAEKQSIEKIQNLFRSYYGTLVFDYQFLDENYRALYATERRIGILSRYFAGVAILISCLGLFGLAAFTAQRRQKEIGIRKVIGASVTDMVMMLSKEFIKLVLISVLIAFPIAWWVTNQWLNDFQYRIHIGVGIFALAAFATIMITLLTIGFQTIRASIANPVKNLRSE